MTLVARLSVATQNSYMVVKKFSVNRGFVRVASISSVNFILTDIKVLISIKLNMHIMPLNIPCMNFGAFNFLHK